MNSDNIFDDSFDTSILPAQLEDIVADIRELFQRVSKFRELEDSRLRQREYNNDDEIIQIRLEPIFKIEDAIIDMSAQIGKYAGSIVSDACFGDFFEPVTVDNITDDGLITKEELEGNGYVTNE